jgi:hypothetical protein
VKTSTSTVLTENQTAIVSLYMNNMSPKLTTAVNGQPEITLTENFPIQKWVFVIISVSSNIVDCYLDGRLVTSYQLLNNTTNNAAGATSLTLSLGSGIDVYMYNFQRWTYPMDPQTAQSTYYYSAPSAKSALDYNMTLAVTKDGTPYSSFSLF